MSVNSGYYHFVAAALAHMDDITLTEKHRFCQGKLVSMAADCDDGEIDRVRHYIKKKYEQSLLYV